MKQSLLIIPDDIHKSDLSESLTLLSNNNLIYTLKKRTVVPTEMNHFNW